MHLMNKLPPEFSSELADAVVPVPQDWLARLRPGDRNHFTDARMATPSMSVSGVKEIVNRSTPCGLRISSKA
jgi:hypothetical protein